MPTLLDAAAEALVQLLTLIVLYFFALLPGIIMGSLTLILGLVVYRQGKRKNYQIMDTYFKLIQKSGKDRFTDFKMVEKSTIGRTYLGEVKPGLSLTDFRVHFTMVHRHLILSKIAAIVRNRRDYVLFEAEPSDNVVKRYQLEILPKREEKRIKALVKMLGQLERIDIGSPQLEDIFIFRVNDEELFVKALRKGKGVIKNLYTQKNQLVRLSYYPLEKPSIRLVAELTDGLNPKQLMDVLFDLTTNIADLGRKGFYAKRRSGLRVVKDENLEKDKRRRAKDLER
ncbi:MAG: hypothetical protein ACFFFH_14300 [Candidatus Thorarchaeota archaeon]